MPCSVGSWMSGMLSSARASQSAMLLGAPVIAGVPYVNGAPSTRPSHLGRRGWWTRTNVRKLAPLDNRVHRCWADSETRGDVAQCQEVLGKHQAANASERRSAHGFLTA